MRSFMVLICLFVLGTPACKSNNSEAKSAANCTKMGAKTGWAGAKTGAKTGVEGMKAAGSAVGGFFEGGSDEAERRWSKGKAETKHVAKEGADETSREAHAPDCP